MRASGSLASLQPESGRSGNAASLLLHLGKRYLWPFAALQGRTLHIVRDDDTQAEAR